MRVTHWHSFPFLLICCCFLSFCVAKLEELGQNGNDILLQIVGCSIIKYFAQFVGFAKRTILLHSLPVVSVYLVRKHQPPQHTVHSLSNSQQWHSHTRKSVLLVLASCRDTCTLCGCLLLFKTERVLSAIQQTCFCQLWVISANY